MKRAILILLALVSVASAQTFITVTADTNRVIRTNFSLVRSQVSDLSGASFAISNITGLQTALDGKLATNGSASGLTNFPASLLTTNGSAAGLTNYPANLLTTNGSASALTNFPAELLRTNGSAAALTNFPAAILQTNSALTNFPAGLLRTNGDGSGLTNLPNANLSNAIGVLPVSNGGSGATNVETARTNFGLVWSGLTNGDAAGFRTALSLGTAATNDATAFQPSSSALTNLAANDASNLTNFPAQLLRTNGSANALTNFPSELLRTNGDGSGLTNIAVFPSYTNNAQKVLAVTTNETGVEWVPVSNTVTDASALTNFPASVLQTGSAETNFPSFLLRTNGNGAGLTNLAAANITGTVALASNVSGTVAIANGGTGASDVTNARSNLLPSYTGNGTKVLALNADGTDLVWTNDSGGSGTVTSVAVSGGTTGLTTSGGPITGSGTITLAGTLSITNGGTGANNAASAVGNLGLQTTDTRKVTLGGSAVTSANDTVAVGHEAKVYSISGSAFGKSTFVTNSNYGVAIGDAATLTNAQRSIALGADSRVTATNSAQIGIGTNSTASTIQFLSSGAVNTTKWGYLANASTQGGYAMTNTAGISGSKTFVAYDGTNYTTNSVTISNGLITGWTP